MNIYCFSTLSFAKLQFKSVINKAFHKHGVASFTDAWIETYSWRGKRARLCVASFTDAWIETGAGSNNKYLAGSHLLQMRGLKRDVRRWYYRRESVASFTDAWIETMMARVAKALALSHLLQMRGLKPGNRTAAPTSRRSHLLQMRGLKHYLSNVPNSYIVSHLLQMRGLKR